MNISYKKKTFPCKYFPIPVNLEIDLAIFNNTVLPGVVEQVAACPIFDLDLDLEVLILNNPDHHSVAAAVELDGIYYMLLNLARYRDDKEWFVDFMSTAIPHELTHIEQYSQGRMSSSVIDGIIWEGELHDMIVPRPGDSAYELNKRHLSQPWEVEANRKACSFSGKSYEAFIKFLIGEPDSGVVY